MIINRKQFWKLYRSEFSGTLPQQTVDGLNYFLDRFETETRIKLIPEFAYVLATAYHESGKAQLINGVKVLVRFQPVKETRERSNSPRRANQDRYWLTGFYGRGFPQTTWERNYLKSGQALGLGDLFVKNPDLLLQPKYAYDAMIICMVKGLYTGKKLSDYINSKITDYKNARRIINGTDKAVLIAGYAKTFEQILKGSNSASGVEVGASQINQPSATLNHEPLVVNPPDENLEDVSRSAENFAGESVSSAETNIPQNTEGAPATTQQADQITNINASDADAAAVAEPDQPFAQYLPTITKEKVLLGGGIVGTGIANMIAWWQNLSLPAQIVLGGLFLMLVGGFIWLLVTHRREISALIREAMGFKADKTKNSPVLVSVKPTELEQIPRALKSLG